MQVIAVTRRAQDAATMRAMGAEAVLIEDITKPKFFCPLFFLSALGICRDWGASDSEVWGMMHDGMLNVCRAAAAAGATRVVVLSAVPPSELHGRKVRINGGVHNPDIIPTISHMMYIHT